MALTIREILVRIRLEAQAFNNGIKAVENGLIRTQADLNNFKAGAFKMGAAVARMSKEFQGWAMSLMFFGMAIQRIFSRVLRGAVGTFTRVMESSEMFGSAIQQLGVHWEYLKFVIGSAINRFLEPLMPIITRVINAIAEWTQKHPKLTSILIIGGLIVGTLIMVFGMLTLAIVNGIIPALIKAGPLFTALGKAIVWISQGIVWLVNTGLSALYKSFVWVGNKAVWLGKTILGTGSIGGAIAGLITLIAYLGFKWDWNWKAMVTNAVVWGMNILKWIVKLGAGIIGVFDIAFGAIKDGFLWVYNWLAEKINGLIDKFADLTILGEQPFAWLKGMALPMADLNGITNALERFKEVQDGIDASFEERLTPWKDALAEWDQTINGGEVAPSNGMSEMIGPATSTQTISIDTINVNTDAVNAEELMADLKRYATITNTGV